MAKGTLVAIWGFALLALPPVTTAQTWNREPDSFHGVKFGATEADVQAGLHPWLCAVSEDLGRCYFKVEVAGRHYDAIASFLGRKLAEVFCIFDENDLSAVRDVLILAYGDSPQHDEHGGIIWIGSRLTASLDHSLPLDVNSRVNQIASARFKFELDLALDTHQRSLDLAMSVYRRTHDKRDADRIAAGASSTFEDSKTAAREYRDRFRAGRYGSFSITLNSYLSETSKRSAEQRDKDAAAIR